MHENRLRFARSLGLSRNRLFEQRQVHGTDVRVVSETDAADTFAELEGDALITRAEGYAVAARTADCVPILIAHPPSGHVAAVHAGWRGAVAGILPRAIASLAHDPSELIVALGPHIRVEAFEIGEEVAAEMRAGGERSSGRSTQCRETPRRSRCADSIATSRRGRSSRSRRRRGRMYIERCRAVLFAPARARKNRAALVGHRRQSLSLTSLHLACDSASC